MNRFFSKLNLQDIKINPEGHHFPPDEDETPAEEDSQVSAEAPEVPSLNQYAPVRDIPAAPVNPPTSPEIRTEMEISTAPVDSVPEADPAPVRTPYANGHAIEEPLATVEYAVANGAVEVAGEVLKVSARSRPSAVAGAIAGVVREAGRAEVQAIGAGATNQAVKAVAIARDYLSETGIDAICVPAFIDVTIDNEDRTAIRLVVEAR